MEGFRPLDKPIEFGYLAAADGLGGYPAFRYRGEDKKIVKNKQEDEAAAVDGFHQVEFGRLDVARDVDYGHDLYRLNPMQLKLYAADIGLELDPDYSIADCVTTIRKFMLSRPSIHGQVCLIAQEIEFDLKGAQDEIRTAIEQAGGFLI